MPKANYDSSSHEDKSKKDFTLLPALSPRADDKGSLPNHRFSIDFGKKKTKDEPSLPQIRPIDALLSQDNRKKKYIVDLYNQRHRIYSIIHNRY